MSYLRDLRVTSLLPVLVDRLRVRERQARIAIEAGIEIHCSVRLLGELKLGIRIFQRYNE